MRTPMDDSLKSIDQHLLEAYQKTSYRIYDPALQLRIGQQHPVLDRWLSQNNFTCWVYLTAYNPGSRLLSDSENQAAQQQLIGQLEAMSYRYFPGSAEADAGDWPPESSLFVPGMPLAEGRLLARRFGQLAFLFGETKAHSRLVVS